MDENLKNLPVEIWQKIFGYLPHQDVLWNVARTCRIFNQLSKSSIRALEINKKLIRSQYRYLMFEALPSFTSLQCLTIHERQPTIMKHEMAVISGIAKLQLSHLELKNCGEAYPIEDILILFKNCHSKPLKLKRLYIAGVDDVNLLLMYILASCINLEEFECSATTKLSNFIVASLEFCFKKLKTLKMMKVTLPRNNSVMRIIGDESDNQDLPAGKEEELMEIVNNSKDDRKLAFTVAHGDDDLEICLGLQNKM